jgi:nucleoside-diphosphate-sugar epimerase
VRTQLSADGIACSHAGYLEPFRIPSEHVLRFYSSTARYSIAKAQSMLGYRPAFDFDRGMQITKEWAKWAELIPQTATQ